MKRLSVIPKALVVSAFLTSALAALAGTDGTWTQAGSGNQDWLNSGNWLNGAIADGTDAAAVFSVNITADQTITNAYGHTVGHLFFQDTTTSTAGGFGIGNSAETALGALTLDVSSGRSVINVGPLNTGSGKKIATSIPLANADGILKIGSGQLSIRADSPDMSNDYVAAGGLTDTRAFLNGLKTLTIVGGAQFQVDFGNSGSKTLNLVPTTLPVTLGGTVQVPNPAIPPYLPLQINNALEAGGTFTVSGRSATMSTQTVASVTFNRGSHTVSVSNAGATSTNVFDPTTFVRNAGAVVNFTTSGAGLSVLSAGGLANDASGLLGGWAISGTNWATVSADNAVVGLAGYQTSLDPGTWAAADNVSLSTNANSVIGTRTINTLRITGNSTNSIGADNTLTLSEGGLIISAGAAQINDGTLQGAVGGDLIVHQLSGTAALISSVIADNGSPASLIKSGTGTLMLTGTNANTYTGGTFVNQGILQVGDGASGGNDASLGTGPVTLHGSLQVNITNNLTIANSMSGSGLLIKQGTGMLTLSGNNTFNGYNISAPGTTVSGAGQSLGFAATRLDAGTIAIANDSALGGVFRFHGANATLRSVDANTRTIPNSIDVATAPTLFGTPDSGNLVFTGPVDTGNGGKTFTINNAVTRFEGPVKEGTAPGANTLTKNGPGTLVLALTTNPNTKPWVVTGGTLQISDEGCLGVNPTAAFVPAQLNLNGGTLKTTASINLDDGNRGITVGTGGGTFDVGSGTTLTISSLNTIAGVDGTLIKAGEGNLVLSGMNSYSGSTIINAGKLTLDSAGSLALASSKVISVGAGATFDVTAVPSFTLSASQTLGGAGTVLGAVTGSGSSVVSPGAGSPGALTLNNDLTLVAGDTLTFDLTNSLTVGGGVNDLLVVNGNLNLSGNVVTIRPLAAGGVLANGTYRLINYTGTKTGSLTVTPSTRFTLTIDESVEGQINLIVSGQPASLVWKGNLSPAWDIGTSANWLNGATPDVFFDVDTVTFNDTAASFAVSLDAAVAPTAMSVNANSDYNFTGLGGLSGTMDLTKGGAGKLILANYGVNTYTGATIITNGTLQIGRNDGSGSIGAGPIINDGALRFQVASASVTVSNLSGTGSLYAESAYQDVILAKSNSYSGPTFVGANSRLALYPEAGSSLASLGSTPGVTVLPDGGFYVTVGGTYPVPLTLNGSGWAADTRGALRGGNVNVTWTGPIALDSDSTIGTDGSTLMLSNSVTGAHTLTKTGAGTVVLAADNAYGATVISEAVLQVGNGGTNGTLGVGPVTDNLALYINRSDNVTIANQITGTGGVLKQGANTVVLAGNNSYDGTTSPFAAGAAGAPATRIDAGTLAVATDTAIGTGILRNNAANVGFRSADANPRTLSNTMDLANDFILGSADTGDLIWNGPINSGGAAKALIISNKVTTVNGVISGGPSANNITKRGPGTLVFNATNTYAKPTVVAEGILLINGVVGPTNVTVSGGVLGGTGVIAAPVAVQAAGTLAPGTSAIGTLTISSTLSLAGTNVMKVNSSAGTSDLVTGLDSVTYGGQLVISNLGGSFATNQSFKLFDAATYSGSFAGIQPANPGSGLAWDTNSLAVDGTLKVVAGGINLDKINLGFAVSGGQIEISWPADKTGMTLEAMTNSLAIGYSTNWFPVPDSTTTNRMFLTIDPNNGTVFYRLVY